MSGNTIEIYEDAAGEYRWRHRMCGQTIAVSSEGYDSRSDCWDVAFRYKAIPTVESIREQHAIRVYRDAADELRWRLRHDNGNIIATPARGYADLQRFERDLRALDGYLSRARMVDASE